MDAEHNQSPNQLFVAGVLGLPQSGLTALDFFDRVSDNYDVEEGGLSGYDGSNGVTISKVGFTLANKHLQLLQQNVNPLDDSSNHGIELYERTLHSIYVQYCVPTSRHLSNDLYIIIMIIHFTIVVITSAIMHNNNDQLINYVLKQSNTMHLPAKLVIQYSTKLCFKFKVCWWYFQHTLKCVCVMGLQAIPVVELNDTAI